MFLTSGMKIKKIRKELKLKQSQIVDESMTRNLVSAIENDKVPLTYNAASIITRVINDYCKKNKINYSVDINYIMEPYEKQVLKYILDIMNNSTDEEFIEKSEELIKLSEEHQLLNEEVKVLKKLGELHYSNKDYMKAEFIFLKAFYRSFRLGNNILYGELLLNLTRSNYFLNKHRENIEITTVMNNIVEMVPTYIKQNILYNKAISYIQIKEEYSAIEELEKLLKIIDPLDVRVNLTYRKTLINSYLRIKNCKRALEVAEELERNIDYYGEEDKIIIKYNFLRIAVVDGQDKGEITKCIKKVLEYINYLLDDNYMSVDIYYYLGRGYFSLGEIEQARSYMRKALLLAVKHNIQADQLTICNFILNSEENLEEEQLEYIEGILESKFSKGVIEDKHKVDLELINYYIRNDMNDRRDNFINKLVNTR